MPLAWLHGRGCPPPRSPCGSFVPQRPDGRYTSAPRSGKMKPAPSAAGKRCRGSSDDGEAARCCQEWPSGEAQLKAARARGCWPDGRPVGRGYPQPCLQAKYAAQIAASMKTAEGRAGGGWLQRLPQPDDYINFQVNGGRRLVVRVRCALCSVTCCVNFAQPQRTRRE